MLVPRRQLQDGTFTCSVVRNAVSCFNVRDRGTVDLKQTAWHHLNYNGYTQARSAFLAAHALLLKLPASNALVSVCMNIIETNVFTANPRSAIHEWLTTAPSRHHLSVHQSTSCMRGRLFQANVVLQSNQSVCCCYLVHASLESAGYYLVLGDHIHNSTPAS